MPIVTEWNLLKYRRTKIIATLGPASADADVIRRLIKAGVNVVRLNMSHGDHAGHKVLYDRVRAVSAELQQPIAVFADLCGPKIRVGNFKDGHVELMRGDRVTVTTRNVEGEPWLIPSQYELLAKDVKPRDRILLDDGALELEVESIADTEVLCRVIHGGTLKNHKGINLPRVDVSAPSLTTKDREDARFALDLGVDFLALSFVRRAEDLAELRQIIRDSGHDAGIIAKIEKPEALDNAVEIFEATDAVMVARGDLGVELHPEQVPIAQHQLIDSARAMNKPVIVATQMLESMIEHARPTRAEVTDISHAVASGADAVMLSAETAAGAHPVGAVEMMERIVRHTEAYQFWHRRHPHSGVGARLHEGHTAFGDAIADAAAQLAYDMEARAIVVISQSGMSAVTISAARPWAPVVGITSSEAVCRRMNLMWGVLPVVADDVGAVNPNQVARRTARELELGREGEYILLVRGFHQDPQMNTPSITLLSV